MYVSESADERGITYEEDLKIVRDTGEEEKGSRCTIPGNERIKK